MDAPASTWTPPRGEDATLDNDQALLARFVAGSTEAFAALFARHAPAVQATCRRVLGDAHAADDAAQAAFIVLFRKAARLPDGIVLASWLHRTACHCALRLRRDAALRARREHEAGAAATSALSAPAPTSEQASLDEALAALPDDLRDTVVLRYVHGLSSEEAAARLGCAEKTVRNRLLAARARLRARLRARDAVAGAAIAVLFAPDAHAAPLPACPIPGAAISPAAIACAGAVATAGVATTLSVLIAALCALAVGIAGVGIARARPAPVGSPAAIVPPLHLRPRTWSVGYWDGDIARLPGERWAALTHVVHVGLVAERDGFAAFDAAAGDALVASAHAHAVPALLHVTSRHDGDLAALVRRSSQTALATILACVDAHGYDGVDLAGIGPDDGLDALLRGLRARLGRRLLCASASQQDAAFWSREHALCDRLAAQTFCLGGDWNPYAWFNAPLYAPEDPYAWSIDRIVRRLTDAGVPPDELLIGLPFFGWVSRGGGIGAPRQRWNAERPRLEETRYGGLLAYDLGAARWDDATHVPWLPVADGWISFDDARSLDDKIDFARSRGLGGWYVWTLDKDVALGADGPHLLQRALPLADRE